MKAMTVLEFLDNLEWGDAFSWDGVTFIPLTAETPLSDLSFALFPEALEGGKVEVREVGEGIVSELEVEVKGEEPVLALQGTVLQGGKQDRTLNISLLLAPRQRQRVPVSCVERGRWRYRRSSSSPTDWTAAMMAHIPLRHLLSLTAHEAYRVRGRVVTDQRTVWAEVRAATRRAGVSSETEAVTEVYHTLKKERGRIIEAMKEVGFPLPQQVGMISVVAGRVWGIDLLPTPAVWAKVWEGIVGSTLYGVREKGEGSENETAAQAFWDSLRESQWEVKKAPVGLGEHWLFRPPLEGFALVYEGGLLHLFAFPRQ